MSGPSDDADISRLADTTPLKRTWADVSEAGSGSDIDEGDELGSLTSDWDMRKVTRTQHYDGQEERMNQRKQSLRAGRGTIFFITAACHPTPNGYSLFADGQPHFYSFFFNHSQRRS